MLLWILLALLAAGVVVLLAKRETSKVHFSKEEGAADIPVYIDQLNQIDVDRTHGLLSEEEATFARTEVARRLLRRDQEVEASLSQQDGELRPSSKKGLAVLFCIPFVALGLYTIFGSPHLPSQPYALRSKPTASEAQVNNLIAKVEARLKEAPEDGTGWDVIAPIYLRLGQYDKALDAYQKATRLLGESPKRLLGLIQADILNTKGQVSSEARALCDRLLQLDPNRLEPRLWIALAKEQDGKTAEAQADYKALLENPNVTSDLRTVLEDRVTALQNPRSPEEKAETGKANPEAERESLPSFTSEERQTIEGMVNRLASRLSSESQDVEGWTKLIRSYMVLGRKEDAQTALTNARRALAKNASSLSTLEAEATQLGLRPSPESPKENRVP